MALDSSFLVGQAPTPLLNPLDIQAKKLAVRNALAAGALQDQQIEEGRIALQQRQQAIADEQRTRAAIATYYGGGTPAASPTGAPAPVANPAMGNALAAGTPPMGTPVNPPGAPMTAAGAPGTNAAPVQAATAPAAAASAPTMAAPPAPVARPQTPTMQDLIRAGVPPETASGLVQTFQKADEGAANIDKLHSDIADAIQEQGASMANGILKSNLNPAVIQYSLQHFAAMGPQYSQMSQQVAQQLQTNPGGARTLFQSLADAGNKQRTAQAAEDTAGAHLLTAQGTAAKDADELTRNKLKDTAAQLGAATNQQEWTAFRNAAPASIAGKFNPLFSPQAQAQAKQLGLSAQEQITTAETSKRDAQTAANEATARQQEGQRIGLEAARFHQQFGSALQDASPQDLVRYQKIANGDLPMPTPRSAGYQKTADSVLALDPTYTEARYLTKKNFKEGQDANNIVSIATVLGHLDSAQNNSKVLGFSPTHSLNWTAAQVRYNEDAGLLTDEMGKLVKGGAITVDESHRLLSNVTSARQSVRDAGIDELKDLMGSRFQGIRQKYRNGANQELPVEMFDQPTQKRLVDQKLISASTGSSPTPPPAPAAPPAPAHGVPDLGSTFNGGKVLSVTRLP